MYFLLLQRFLNHKDYSNSLYVKHYKTKAFFALYVSSKIYIDISIFYLNKIFHFYFHMLAVKCISLLMHSLYLFNLPSYLHYFNFNIFEGHNRKIL